MSPPNRPGRFGHLGLSGDGGVHTFEEKPAEGGWINGGFFILHRSVFNLIEGDRTVFEREPLGDPRAHGQLVAYRHRDSGNASIRSATRVASKTFGPQARRRGRLGATDR